MGSQKQEYRDAIAWLRAMGWRVDEERKGYPMAFCPCGLHHRSVHRSPSNPNYYKQMKQFVESRGCGKESK